MDTANPQCQRCGSATEFVTMIAPLGSEPGHHIFRCEKCREFTWRQWRATGDLQDTH